MLAPPLVALGLPVLWLSGSSTAAFSFHYSGDRREMVVDALGDPWSVEDVRELGEVRWVHVGPLASSDFPAETLAELARGRRVSLDGQGLVRPARTGPLKLGGAADPGVLRHVSILKLSEEEARALLGEADEPSLRALGVPEVVVTRGSRGSLVLADGLLSEAPAQPVGGPIDPTGAGDAFAAAYLVARSSGHAPVAAARARPRWWRDCWLGACGEGARPHRRRRLRGRSRRGAGARPRRRGGCPGAGRRRPSARRRGRALRLHRDRGPRPPPAARGPNDAGRTWREAGGGLPAGFAVAIADDNPDYVVYAARNRLYLSEDGGRFWRSLAPELPRSKPWPCPEERKSHFRHDLPFTKPGVRHRVSSRRAGALVLNRYASRRRNSPWATVTALPPTSTRSISSPEPSTRA